MAQQEVLLGLRLDAFANDAYAEFAPHADDSPRPCGIAAALGGFGDERTVDLQFVQGQALEMAQRRESDADADADAEVEVVQRQPVAAAAQTVQQRHRLGHVEHHHRFRHLLGRAGRWHAVARGRRLELGQQRGVRQPRGSQVHPQLWRPEAHRVPVLQRTAGGFQHPVGQRQDEPGFFGQRNESQRRQQATPQLLGCDGGLFGHPRQPRQVLCIHGIDGDPGAGRQHAGAPFHLDGMRDGREQALGHGRRLVVRGQRSDHHREGVAADSRHHAVFHRRGMHHRQIIAPDPCPQALGHDHQHGIAAVAAEGVVDAIEAVQVLMHHGAIRVLAFCQRQQGRGEFGKELLVRQACGAVVVPAAWVCARPASKRRAACL